MNLEHPPDGSGSAGDHAQVHRIVRQVIDTYREYDVPRPAEVPTPLKWAGGIVAALFTAGTATLAFWIVTSVSEMQVTLARMDERLASQANGQDARVAEIERRVAQLEALHRQGGQ